MSSSLLPRLGLLAGIAILGCTDATTSPNARPQLAGKAMLSVAAANAASYVLIAPGTSLRAGLVADVEAAGGTVVSSLGEIGVVLARSSDPNFAKKAARISGISDAVRDISVRWVEPPNFYAEVEATEAGIDAQSHDPSSTGVGSHENFRLMQWAPDAVSAPAAWDAGYRGAAVRVAVLDGGIHNTHVDLVDRVDVARSISFAVAPWPLPTDDPTLTPFNSDVGTFWHGTHVAGILAASANNIGTVGIAPEATIIGVKVLHNETGTFSAILQGIVYAAKPINEGGAGADIINMSIGASFLRQGAGNALLASLVSRATSYANQRGVTVVAAVGNAEGTKPPFDLDHTANLILVPAQSTGVIAVSATGPRGWGANPGANLDRFASYSHYGQSAVGLAAPGGDAVLPGNAVCSRPGLPTGTLFQFCWAMDMVIAPIRGSGASTTTYSWAAGTSMASPVVAGVAALIFGKAKSEGVRLTPSQVRARLEKSADDLGKPGNDDFYGAGRVNAFRAIQ